MTVFFRWLLRHTHFARCETRESLVKHRYRNVAVNHIALRNCNHKWFHQLKQYDLQICSAYQPLTTYYQGTAQNAKKPALAKRWVSTLEELKHVSSPLSRHYHNEIYQFKLSHGLSDYLRRSSNTLFFFPLYRSHIASRQIAWWYAIMIIRIKRKIAD